MLNDFKVDGVIVCVGFGDFLATTLPYNRDFFDRVLIVSSPEDKETRRVAARYGADVAVTECFRDEHGPFNKGKAINHGLGVLSGENWLCHIDADILLPAGLRGRLPEKIIKKDRWPFYSIFGIQRLMCESFEEWGQYLASGDKNMFRQEAQRKDRKHLPVGFFQLWHSSKRVLYPTTNGTATTSDLEFSRQFGFNRYHFADEFCIHLSSIPHKRGTDWSGRTSPAWGPKERGS